MRKKRLLSAFALALVGTLVSGCDLLTQIQEGTLTIQLGDYVLFGPGNDGAQPAAIHSGLPGTTAPAAAATAFTDPNEMRKKSTWGSCDEGVTKGILGTFKKAEAEIREIWLFTHFEQRSEKLLIEPKRIDLFRLASEVSEILQAAPIPPGEYREVKMLLSQARIVDNGGKVWPLQIPQADKNHVSLQLERNLIIESTGERPRINLTFCTETNFVVESEGKATKRVEFHPVIDKIFNLSI
jgi:hypothetical protein